MLRQENQGLVNYRFDSLSGEGVLHAVFTRLGGVSRGPFATLNVGHTVGDDQAAVAENHARIYAHLGLDPHDVATARQVHGNRVAVVAADDAGRLFPATDALVTHAAGVALLLRFADCQPILLYDPRRHALGLIHAGWRGLAQGIAYRAVQAMHDAFGSEPHDLIAGLGPAVGPCCYLIGDEAASAMGYALPHWRQVMRREGDRWRLDLPAANAQQLADAGVRSIEQAGLCTCCHRHEFFSHRGDGGLTGRFAVVAALEPRDGGDRGPQEMTARPGREAGEAVHADSLHPPGLPAFGELAADPGSIRCGEARHDRP